MRPSAISPPTTDLLVVGDFTVNFNLVVLERTGEGIVTRDLGRITYITPGILSLRQGPDMVKESLAS